MSDIEYRRVDGVEVITLNRPEVKNALTYEMTKELSRYFVDLGDDDEVRVVMLTGAGGAFCSGADLTGKGGREDALTPVGMRQSTLSYSRMVYSLANLEKPVIAAVSGPAVGAGCNLALACDLLIASQEAQFIQVFARRGFVVDTAGSFFLTRSVGLPRAKELMFTGRPVGADEALELGMVNRVVTAESLEKEAMELARKLARGPTRALGMIKKLVNASFESNLAYLLELEATYQGVAVGTDDFKEGVVAFLEKREPRFKGR